MYMYLIYIVPCTCTFLIYIVPCTGCVTSTTIICLYIKVLLFSLHEHLNNYIYITLRQLYIR